MEVRIVRRGYGALEGLGLGIAVGVPMGAVVGVMDPEDQLYTRSYQVLFGVILLGGLGVLIGSTVEASRGSTEIFDLHHAEPSPAPVESSDRSDP